MINNVSFSDFLNAFGDGYNRMINAETKQVFNKQLFCRELLCRISKDTRYVIYINGIEKHNEFRFDVTFSALYREKKRRSLKPIAKYLVSGTNRDEEKFKDFLQEYVMNYPKEKLLNNFKKYLPDTNLETLFDDITGLFVKIIISAANEPDMRKSKAVKKNDSSNDDSVIYEDINQIPTFQIQNQTTVNTDESDPLFMLKTTIDSLIEKSKILNVSQYGSDIYKKCDKEVNDGIERLLLINSMLIDQNKLMPSEELKSIIEIIPYITKDKVINYKANCAYIDSIQISPIQIILKLLQ